jgi:nucleobase:cation symporter-1, NCS1 family
VPSAIIAILVAVFPAWQAIAPFAWYVGTALGGGLYAILVRRERGKVEGTSL